MKPGLGDPTLQSPSAAGAGATLRWSVSLAEVDALCRKAARGAGFTWGMAEEAGRAARTLAAFREPGPEAVLQVLDAVGHDIPAHAPLIANDCWYAPAGLLCPIATGAALSDRAAGLQTGQTITLEATVCPLLLLPFLWASARDLNCVLELHGGNTSIQVRADGWCMPRASDIGLLTLHGLQVSTPGTLGGVLRTRTADHWNVAVENWQALDRYAQRTYAPATQSSRAGAGAGERDDD